MKEKMLIALSHTLKGYLTEPNATRLIQKAFRTIEQHLHANYLYIALQNNKTSCLDIPHYHKIPRQAVQNFHKKIGSNTIGRVFFKNSLNLISKEINPDDYYEMKIDSDYELCVAAHIGWEGRTFGFLACYFNHSVELEHGVKNFILAMAGAISAALEKESLLKIISELKQFDVETGIYTHQFFISRLEKEISKSLEEESALALVVIEMENLKSVINLHGNEIANQLLKEIAELLKANIRGCDVLGSLGIDEFILFMPDTKVKQAERIIRTFQSQLKNLEITDQNLTALISVGLTELHENDDLESFLGRAQLALYTARKSGEGAMIIEA
jgi:diguanylate cyclase (GGDEF)-like protein